MPNSIAGKPDLSIDPSRRIDAKNSTSYSFSAPRNWIVKGLLSFVPRASFFFVCRSRPNWRRRRPKRESNSTSEWESLAVNFVFFFISFSIASTSVAGASLLTVRRRRCSGENRAAVAMATRRARYIDSRRRFSRARRRRARGKMFVEKKINKSNTSNCALMIFFSRL